MSRDLEAEEEMHTAPHPTLGQLEASLLGSKGLFQRFFEEGDSMAPWQCPRPTTLPAWRSLCPSPTFRSSRVVLPFPAARLIQGHMRSQYGSNLPKRVVKPVPPPCKKPHSHHLSTTKPPTQPPKDRHRGPIQLRSSLLRQLRHSDISTAPTEQSSRKASLLYRSCI